MHDLCTRVARVLYSSRTRGAREMEGGEELGQDRPAGGSSCITSTWISPFLVVPIHANRNARVDAQTKAAFKALAEQRGCRESDLIVAAIHAMTGTEPAAPPARRGSALEAATEISPALPLVSEKLERQREKTAMKRIYVRVPEFLYKGVKRQVSAKRMNGARAWVSALIQSNLLRAPVMTVAQLVELRRSRMELAAMGRNLNQIARNLNLAPSEFERVRLELLQDLNKKLNEIKRQLAVWFKMQIERGLLQKICGKSSSTLIFHLMKTFVFPMQRNLSEFFCINFKLWV